MRVLLNSISVMFLAFVPFGVAKITTPPSVAAYPEGFIPVGEDENEVLINVRQIIDIVPFPEIDTFSREEDYLEVTFSDGTVLRVFEDYKKFRDRIRKSIG